MRFSTFKYTTSAKISRLSKILQQIETYPVEIEITAAQATKLKLLLTETKSSLVSFEKSLNKFITSEDSEFEANENDVVKFQDDILDLCINIETKVTLLLQHQVGLDSKVNASLGLNESVSEQTQPNICSVRLPKLELKSFNGDTKDWITFINLFDTTIHANSSLSLVQKHQYLLSSLEGEALHLVKSLPISPGNYKVAYNTLRERYHSTRRLISFHLNKIIDLPNITDKSVKQLRSFLNDFNENEQALQALDCNILDNNPLLSLLIMRKMDTNLCKQFESQRDDTSTELPKVSEVIDFLKKLCVHNEDASLSCNQSHNKSSAYVGLPPSNRGSGNPKIGSQRHNVTLVSTDSSKCFCCLDSNHNVYTCPNFKAKTPQERFKVVREANRCVNCFGSHTLKACKSKQLCKTCSKPHHSLLHFSKPKVTLDGNNDIQDTAMTSDPLGPKQTVTQIDSLVCKNNEVGLTKCHSTVLLATTLVKVKTSSGISHVFRGLLDSASQCSFITEHAAQLLNVSRSKSSLSINGISGLSTRSKGSTLVTFETLSGQNVVTNHPVIILEKITSSIPQASIDPKVISKAKKFILADPSFAYNGPIDILLGGDLFAEIFTGEIHALGENLPKAVGTVFGFTIMGKAPCIVSDIASSNYLITLLSLNDMDLHNSLQRFWHLEEPPQCSPLSKDELFCIDNFKKTYSRDDQGRYVVRLPFKPSHETLGTSYDTAKSRLLCLENKFSSQPLFKEKYVEFFKDYHSLGHMVCNHSGTIPTTPHCFLPHHGVVKETSSTTKLRVVFDASSCTSNQLSLNDILLSGPKLQTDVCEVLINFRKYKIIFSCDIKQMYRQIKVHPDDQNFQLILWRENNHDPISVFKLTTVTYGMNCSPFLAISTLNQLAADEGDLYPGAKHILLHQTYMDDCIGGHDSEDEALELRNQLIDLLKKGGFELRKWTSNSSKLLDDIPQEHREIPLFFHNTIQQAHFSILGLRWSDGTDSFSYYFNQSETLTTALPTKRKVLSIIAQIFDPVGFLSPVIMKSKLFMQHLWTININWDDPLPLDLANVWNNFVKELSHISHITVPRSLCLTNRCTIQLHGFADASIRGYAGVVYLRTLHNDGHVIIRQLISKTRLAPLKTVSLPRLELCGSHLLAKLMNYCIKIFSTDYNIELIRNWCDSTIVLTWISTQPYNLKTFVSNRVAEIQELTPPHSWHHVMGTDNAADCASRGLSPSELQEHPLWWSGPKWLLEPPSEWPTSNIDLIDSENIPELRSDPLTVLVSSDLDEFNVLNKFSKWTKLLNVLAYIKRFINNCRSNEKERKQNSLLLTLTELKQSESCIIKLVQQASFSEEIKLLTINKPCRTHIQRLAPFIDHEGILRVGGRLRHSDLSFDSKHPILLPKSHHVTSLLIDFYHLKHMHAGPHLLQALLHQRYWILSARSAIRSRIFRCVKCFRCKPKNTPPLMGDLPSSRITCSRPFSITGLDFCGPFKAKSDNLRSSKVFKIYIGVFICFVTKAIHLEPVTDLSTSSFLAALDRFVSRRSLPVKIYSDCGTNFKGADSHFKSLFKQSEVQKKIVEFCNLQSIEFHFNPPASPHQGGLWESAVRSMKFHLGRIVTEEIFTVEEFFTLTAKIEAILNSRPLTPLSSDPSDFSALTPGHFLVGTPLISVPEPDFTNSAINRLKRWQRIQAFTQNLWRRWSQEYLNTLQQRTKWIHKKDNLKIGDLVVLQDSRTAPLCWPLGRVISTSPGKDGVVRVVTVKTSNGTYTRPVIKVFPLPIVD